MLNAFVFLIQCQGNLDELFERIKAGPEFVLSKAPLSKDAKDLLRLLLSVDPNHRISSQEAQNHKWFLTANENDMRHTSIVQSLKQLSQVVPDGTGNTISAGVDGGIEGSTDTCNSNRMLSQNPITTAQLYFTERLSEIEDIFA